MRLVLCLLLAFAASPAWAEWVKVVENNNGFTYIDPATIGKDGNLRRVWMIADLKQRDRKGYMSRRALWGIDCKQERVRVLAETTHRDPMAGGTVLSVADQPDTGM
jgi:hypothetical protein